MCEGLGVRIRCVLVELSSWLFQTRTTCWLSYKIPPTREPCYINMYRCVSLCIDLIEHQFWTHVYTLINVINIYLCRWYIVDDRNHTLYERLKILNKYMHLISSDTQTSNHLHVETCGVTRVGSVRGKHLDLGRVPTCPVQFPPEQRSFSHMHWMLLVVQHARGGQLHE